MGLLGESWGTARTPVWSSCLRGFPGANKDPCQPSCPGGLPEGTTRTPPTRLSRERTERKAGAGRPYWGRRPQAVPIPRPKKDGGWRVTRSPGTPAALGLQPAARGRRPDPGAADPGSRPAIGTHRHGHLGRHSRSPDGQRRRQAGGSCPPRRSEPRAPGPCALGGPSGLLRAPGGRTVRPLKPALRMRRPRGPSPLPSPPRGQH